MDLSPSVSTLVEALIFLMKYPLLIQLTALLVGRWLDDCLSVAFPGRTFIYD